MGRRGGVLRDGMVPWRRSAGTTALSICLAVTGLLLVAAPGRAGASTPPEPAQDPFYDAPANLASDANGAVIASRAVTIGLFGALAESVHAWQVLYRTTDTQGDPEATVATIIEPEGAAPANRPLVSYQVAEDSLGPSVPRRTSFRRGRRAPTR